MKKIKVFVAAGSATPYDKSILQQGKKLGAYLGENGYTFVQGGSKKGLMGASYNEFVKHSDDVIIHLWDIFSKDNEKYVKKIKLYSSLNLRLEGFLKDSDVAIVLPGANGTMHEFCTFFEYGRYFRTNYKIILVNYKGFYNGLLDQIDRQVEEGFFKEYQFEKIVDVVDNVEEAIKLLPKIKK